MRLTHRTGACRDDAVGGAAGGETLGWAVALIMDLDRGGEGRRRSARHGATTTGSVEQPREKRRHGVRLAAGDHDPLLVPPNPRDQERPIEHLVDDVAIVLEAVIDDLRLARAIH